MGSARAKPMEMTDGDADKDGVLDSMDQCPGTPAGVEVDSKGCPLDDDADGVPNHQDDCLNTTNRRARIDSSGCYIKLDRRVDFTLNVEFDFDSSKRREEHTDEVGKVADFMEEYPHSKVVMEGHTDGRGDEEYNQSLSERRAKTIADMLADKFGIAERCISSRGHGESQPIDTNDTAAGRQNNRRVVAVKVSVPVLVSRAIPPPRAVDKSRTFTPSHENTATPAELTTSSFTDGLSSYSFASVAERASRSSTCSFATFFNLRLLK